MKNQIKDALEKLGCAFRDCPKCAEVIDVSIEGRVLTFVDSFNEEHDYDLLSYVVSLNGTDLVLTGSDGVSSTVDLRPFLDDTNLPRIVSASLTGGTVTFLRDDNSSFDLDLSTLLDDTNLPRIVSASISNNVVTFTRDDNSSFDLDLTTLASKAYVDNAIPVGSMAFAINGAEVILGTTESQHTFGTVVNTPEVTLDVNGSVTINTDGVYKLTYKVNMEDRQNARQNVYTIVKVNGVDLLVSKSYTYVRNQNDGLATATFHGIHSLVAGDVVTFHSSVIPGNPGNVAILANESFFQIEHKPNLVVGGA